MKKQAKRWQGLLLTIFVLLFSVVVAACGSKKADGDVLFREEGTLVISVTGAEDGSTLKDVMKSMQEKGKLAFSEDGNGFIKTVDGYSKTGEYWFLYTSCTEYTNVGYGTTVYEGKEYASAILGYESLPAVEGALYIWKSAAW